MTPRTFSFSESLPFYGGNTLLSSPPEPLSPKISEPVSESSTIAPEILEKPSLTPQQRQELSRQFSKHVERLHRESGREVRRPPRVGRRELDLYELYKYVEERGGYNSISQWKDLGQDLELPETVTNSGYILRTKYEQFILPYEADLRRRFPLDRPEIELIQPQMAQGGDDGWMVACNSGINEYNNALYLNENENENELTQNEISTNEYGNEYGNNEYGNEYNNNYNQLSFSNPNESYYNHIEENILQQPQQKQSQLRVFRLNSFPFTAESLEKLLGAHQGLQELEIGSLRQLKRAPAPRCFPPGLRRLVLQDVPQAIANDLLAAIQHLQLVELNIEIIEEEDGAENENRIEKYSFAPSSLD